MVNYWSIFKPSDTLLARRFKQSMEPRRAELYLFGIENDLTVKLVDQGVADGIKFDVDLDRDQQNIDQTMHRRVQAGITQQPAFHLDGEFVDEPISVNPKDFKPFDYADYLEEGGEPIRELWISNEAGDGLFVPGIDATAYAIMLKAGLPPNGNPRCNPNMITDFISDVPGENGSLVWADEFGFRVKPHTEGANRYQCIFIPGTRGAWAFRLANPVSEETGFVASRNPPAAASKKKAPTPKKKK